MKVILFIYEIFKKYPILVIASTALLIVVNLTTVFSLVAIGPIVDFFIHPDLQGISPFTTKAVAILEFFNLPVTLGVWLIVLVVLVALTSVFRIFARHSILKAKYVLLRDMTLGTFEDFFNARWYFFSSGKQGVLLNTFTRELRIVGDAFGAMALFFAGILQVIFCLAVPFYLSWQVTTISLGVALLFTVPFILLGRLSYRLGILNTSTANQLMSVIHENFSLAKLVLGFGNQRKSTDNLGSAFDTHCRVTIKSQILNIAIPIFYYPLAIVAVVIALFSARRFGVPLSEITVLLLALRQVAVSIGGLTAQKNSLENFFPSYEQVKALRQRAKELKQTSGDRPFSGFIRELLIEELSFAYPGQEPVLVNINTRIPKGKMVAFVGESGVGKSTLIDMIMGFHQPTRGRIMFDGTPLQDFDILSYRRRIGYVPQDSVLFYMSIRDNLLWARESAADEEIIHACRQANADEFIREFPEGYNTLVGDRGVRLSGGQVQRIALARAILRRPDLLILDEATSSLDTHSERLIQQAIENIAKETTVIVIAHRLSTIVNADYIYVLKEGRLIEKGTYPQLVQKDSYFNRMVKLQTLKATQ